MGMVLLRGLLAALFALAGLVVLAPAPALACSCVMGQPAQFTRWADVVVVGTVADRQDPPEKKIMSSTAPVTYTIEVRKVLKGDAGATTEVTSALMGMSCGLENIEIGKEYVVFANGVTGDLGATSCGGTRLASPGFVEKVEAVTGPGEVVGPAAAESRETSDGDADEGNLAGDDPPAQSVVPWWGWLAGAGLLAALGAIAGRRLRA